VPTDVRPVYDLALAQINDLTAQGAQFQLSNALGETIALTSRVAHFGHFELASASELRPETTYRLNGRWTVAASATPQVETSLSFTTGAGPLGAAPAPPDVSIVRYSLQSDEPGSDCDPAPTGSCISFPAGVAVAATTIDVFGQENAIYDVNTGKVLVDSYLLLQPWLSNLFETGSGVDCLKLKARAENGLFSQPVVVCGRDIPTYNVKGGSPQIACSPLGLVHDGQLVSPNVGGGGCSCTLVNRRAPAPLLPFMLLAFHLAGRWWRRSTG
jgi:hypothetical protein